MMIRIGQVSARKGYRLHALTGHYGAHRVIATRDLTTDNVPLICKRCRHRLRAEIEAALTDATTASGNRYNPELIAALTALADAFKTPTERASDAELLARIAETITAANVVQQLPEQPRRRTWADLRREFAATHPQPTQPALFAA